MAIWLKNLKLPKYVTTVVLLTAANLLILAFRNWYVGDTFYHFLKSNLFIGSFPTILIAFLMQRYYNKLNTFWFWFGSLVWLLFYPNAPYMISDLIHNGADPLNATHDQLIVYDTFIIFSIAMLSLFYGFLSIKIMYSLFIKKYSMRFAKGFISITLILSCLGFYMGREMLSAIHLGNGYLYSWELFLEPVQIIKAVWNLLFPIGTHIDAYLMMALFGVVQYMLIVMFKDINDIENPNDRLIE